jgi:hypothetical protein
MIKGLAAEDGDLALDRLPRAGLCHLGFLSMKLILVVRSVSVVMALTGHSASRRDRRQANRQRLRQLDHALGTRVCLRRPPPSRHLQRGGRSVGPAQLLREWALASVDDPNTTLAIFEWSAEDGCAVDDWDAIAQGTPGLGYTVSHEAILSSLAMDPAPGVQDRGDVPEHPVAGRTRFPAGVVLLRGPTSGAPSACTDHESETGSPRVCDSMPRFDSLEPPGKIEPAPRPAGPDCRRDNISVAVGLSYNRPSGGRRPLRKKQRNAESHPGLRSPTAHCDDCSK